MEYFPPPSSFPSLDSPDPSTSAAGSFSRHDEWHLPLPHGGPSVAPGEPGLEETMWRLTLRPQEGVDSPYPERPGEPDCTYYMRTGLCGFGIHCRFNHPPNRRLAPARSRGEYPERSGQPECQYYLKTGTCKFGATCKYHHPREKAGLAGRAQLNVLNLPLRPGEKECAYYMRTGSCKYGSTCKFNHPQPALVSMPGSTIFPGAGSGPASAPQPYPAGLPAWPMVRPPPYLPAARFAGPSPNFAPVLLPSPQGVVSVPGWNPYQSPLAAQEGQQHALPSYMYGAAPPQDPVAMGLHATFPPFMPGSASMRLPAPPPPSTAGSREPLYPERPGLLECQYFMRTGECRFGSQCRYHHPRDRNLTSQATLLSPMGLPLRPGVPPCTFYSRNGYCKFGPTCKYDHPFLPPYNSSVAPYSAGVAPSAAPSVPASSESPLELMRQPGYGGTASSGSDVASPTSGGVPRHSVRESLQEGGSS